MRVVLTIAAERDLKEAEGYIAQGSEAAAERFLARFHEVMGLPGSGVVQGPAVQLRDGREAVAWSLPPYRIYYRLRGSGLEVLRVDHQARRPIEK